MALLSKVGSFQASTAVATTVVQVRGVGFQPKVAIFWWNGRDGAVDASGEADLRFGFGWMLSASSRHCLSSVSDHGATVGECDSVKYNDACIASIIVGTGDPQGVDGKWDFSAWDADGFDLIVDDAFATVFQVHYLALGGDDVEQVAAGSFTSPATPTTLDVTPGFQPDTIVILSDGRNNENTIAVDGQVSLGVACGLLAAESFTLAGFSDDGPTTSDTASYFRRGGVLAILGSTTTVSIRASLDSWLPNGFRLSFATSATRIHYYLAIKGPQCKVGNFETSVTLNATQTQSIGFQPKALMFFSSWRAENAIDTPSAHWSLSIGAATGAAERSAQASQDKDAIGTMDCFTALEYDEVYINANVAATQAIEGLMDLDAVLFDGFRTIMDDGDDAANFVAYLAIGGANPTLLLKPPENTLLRM